MIRPGVLLKNVYPAVEVVDARDLSHPSVVEVRGDVPGNGSVGDSFG